ncbi:MAG: S-layer homology domain-containing protein [Acidimicrobiales bacterium]
MAAFLGRLHATLTDRDCPTPTTPFTDVPPTSFAHRAIACIYGLGITTGTSATTYSPHAPVTREQMAAFLIRLYDAVVEFRTKPTPSTSTSSPTTTTGPVACCGEGHLGLVAIARPEFNAWTDGGHWEWIRSSFDGLVVYEPYWDSRLVEYDEVFAYRNSYGIAVDPAGDSRAVDHPEWLLRDASGEPVYIPFRCGSGCERYAADVGNAAFRADFVAYLKTLRSRGYRGLFLDDVNLAWRFGDATGADTVPIDPRTGEPLTIENWQRYMVEFLELIRAELPDVTIMHNVIWYVDSPTYDNPWVDREIAAADVLVLDRGVNDGGLVGGTKKFGLQTFLAHVDRSHALGTNVLMIDEVATNAQEQMFNLAGALLVNEGADLISTDNFDMLGPDTLWSGFQVDLGHALGPRHVEDGVIRREFTGGMVIMNEPKNPPVTISLPRPMRTLDGATVTSVHLGTREATVLRNA